MKKIVTNFNFSEQKDQNKILELLSLNFYVKHVLAS